MVDIHNHFQTTSHKLKMGMEDNPHRTYLGMSGIGHPCSRYLWYSFRHAYISKIPTRVKHIFSRGDRIEEGVVEALQEIGIKYEKESSQIELVDGFGHIKGHADGIVSNVLEAPKTRHLLEVKSMKESAFKDYLKKGLKQYSSTYWGQIQAYMYKLGLKRTLYIVVNKNTDEVSAQRYNLEESDAKSVLKKGISVVLSDTPPPRAFSKTYYMCKWCDAYDICHKGEPMAKSCRTCKHVCVEHEGKWSCSFHNAEIPLSFMPKGCEHHEMIDNT